MTRRQSVGRVSMPEDSMSSSSSDQNHSSPSSLPTDVPLTIEIDEEKATAVPMTPSDDSSEHMSSPGFHSADLMDVKIAEELTVALAVATDKAKLRQLSQFLEKWVSLNNNNLYPSRQEKEQLAKKVDMTYIQVNRWFANRRRKVIKRTNKVAPSPASVTPEPVAPDAAAGRMGFSVSAEQISTFLHAAFAAQQPVHASTSPVEVSSTSRDPKQEEDETASAAAAMVMNTTDTPLTPPADHELAGYSSQVVPDMGQYAADMLALQKLLSLSPQLQGYNQLALLGINPLQLYQAQLQLAQQQIIQQQLQAHLLAAQQEQHARLQQQQWMAGSISASPAHISDSEISEMSEFSPPPVVSSQMPRPHSPFKDPHGIADTDMLALMSLSKLSEREQQAVNCLLEMSTDCR